MELTQVTSNASRMTPADRQQIVSLYLAGTRVADIPALTGWSTYAIYSTLTREGIERRRRSSGTLRTFCEVCGKPVRYVTPARREAEGIGRFCSQACMGEARRLPATQCGATAEDLLCTRCEEVKPVVDFYPHASTARGYQYWCRTCCQEVRTERAKIPEDSNSIRRRKLREAYGMTMADYDAMFDAQEGRCAICGTQKEPWEPGWGVEGRGRCLVVDHCHTDGRIRGLLCGNCNHGLGKFKDDIAHLLAAAEYLRSDAIPREIGTAPA